jgi:hypothetical protein
MIAELMVANQCFDVLKKTVMNGRDIMTAGKAISKFVQAEEELQARGNAKKNSIWRRIGGSDGSDLEEFMALEQIAAKKAELRSMMQLYGRGGMYNDFVRFQAEQRKKRQEAIEDQRKRRQRLVHGVLATVAIIVTGSIILAVLIALRGTMR